MPLPLRYTRAPCATLVIAAPGSRPAPPCSSPAPPCSSPTCCSRSRSRLTEYAHAPCATLVIAVCALLPPLPLPPSAPAASVPGPSAGVLPFARSFHLRALFPFAPCSHSCSRLHPLLLLLPPAPVPRPPAAPVPAPIPACAPVCAPLLSPAVAGPRPADKWCERNAVITYDDGNGEALLTCDVITALRCPDWLSVAVGAVF